MNWRPRALVSGKLMVPVVILACFGGCKPRLNEQQARGAAAIAKYGCGSCHTVKGIRGAIGKIGAPLTGIGSRVLVAGMLQNTPENMTVWIHDPKSINPGTAMPKMGVSGQEASDIAAYLRAE